MIECAAYAVNAKKALYGADARRRSTLKRAPDQADAHVGRAARAPAPKASSRLRTSGHRDRAGARQRATAARWRLAPRPDGDVSADWTSLRPPEQSRHVGTGPVDGNSRATCAPNKRHRTPLVGKVPTQPGHRPRQTDERSLPQTSTCLRLLSARRALNRCCDGRWQLTLHRLQKPFDFRPQALRSPAQLDNRTGIEQTCIRQLP